MARPLRHARASIAILLGAAIAVGCGSSQGARAERTSAARTSVQGTSAATSTAAGPAAAGRCTRRATPSQTEGPYFKSGSPARTSLLATGVRGTRLVLTGRVMTSRCKVLQGVKLDFWQANASGVYDTAGYRLRGHQLTGSDGRFVLTTIVPGEYAGRTEHIHVKVTRPGRGTLTTQLYFPGVARNDEDGIFDARLLMRLRTVGAEKRGAFDFVLPA